MTTPSPNQKDLSLFLQASQVNTPIEIVPPSQQVTRLFAFWSNSAVNKGELDQEGIWVDTRCPDVAQDRNPRGFGHQLTR